MRELTGKRRCGQSEACPPTSFDEQDWWATAQERLAHPTHSMDGHTVWGSGARPGRRDGLTANAATALPVY